MKRRDHNAATNGCGGEQRFSRDCLLGPDEAPRLASHLVTPRSFYRHHGIYVGNGRVIHYAGLARGLQRGPVEEVSLRNFARGREVWLRHGVSVFDRREVVERARSRLGERSYRLLTNNCEHFCDWVLRGESRSRQVERLRGPSLAAWSVVCAWMTRSTERLRPVAYAVDAIPSGKQRYNGSALVASYRQSPPRLNTRSLSAEPERAARHRSVWPCERDNGGARSWSDRYHRGIAALRRMPDSCNTFSPPPPQQGNNHGNVPQRDRADARSG
jgi:hypothetical protein